MYATGHLEAVVVVVLTQLKLLATGVFTVLFLGRSLSLRKWRALVGRLGPQAADGAGTSEARCRRCCASGPRCPLTTAARR